jgi:SAM-dependent methyltransferase
MCWWAKTWQKGIQLAFRGRGGARTLTAPGPIDDEAAHLIAPAVPARASRWADLGAGTGTFTRALSSLLAPGAEVYAIDRDPRAVSASAVLATDGARINPLRADFADPGEWDSLALPPLDGILLANALHFVADQASVLARLAAGLRPGGRLVVVEYEGRPASRWVPYPVSSARLADLLPAGMSAPVRAGSRPSAFGGTMYAAWAERVEER